MRRLLLILCLALAAPAVAQQATEAPGFFDRLFGTDEAENDAEQGSLLERLIEDKLSGSARTVTIRGFEGALSGQATLDSLTISDNEGVWLTLEDATLDWNRTALFAGRLEVAELTAARILLPRLATPVATNDAPTPEATGFALPELPVSIEIGRIAAEDVQIGEPVFGAEVRAAIEGALSLSGGEGTANLAIERKDGVGTVTLDAGYANATRVLKLDLSVQEAENGILATMAGLPGTPSVDFRISGTAPLSEYAADIRLATDGAERLAGQIALSEAEDTTRRITANISGDIAPVLAPAYRPFFGDQIALNTEALIAPDGQITVPRFALEARALFLNGSLQLGADRLPRRIAFTGQIASADGMPVLLPVGGTETRIDHADLMLRFDASKSEDWTGDITVTGLDRDGLSAGTLALSGTGRIVPGATPSANAAISFDARALDTGIAGLAEAIGTDLSGKTSIAWQSGSPVEIDGLELAGKAMSASGNARIDMADTGPQVDGALKLSLQQLANFSALAKRPVSGTADLDTTFSVAPLAGAFDVRADGQTQDVTIGDPRADAILAGLVQLDVQAIRDESGMRITLERLGSDAAELTASADLKSGGSIVLLEGELKETAVLLPTLTGPSRLKFAGQEDAERDWTIQTELAGPNLSANVDGKLSDIYDLPAFAGQIAADVADLSPFSELVNRPLGGKVTINATTDVNADLSRVSLQGDVTGEDLRIGQAETDRLLAGTMTAKIDAKKTGDQVQITTFDFSTAQINTSVEGNLSDIYSLPAFEGHIAADVADLSVFSDLANRPLGGQLAIDATTDITADLSRASVQGEANGQDLSIGQLEADRLLAGTLAAKLDASKDGDQIRISNLDFSTALLTANISGELANDDAKLAVDARLADLAPFASGFSGPLSVNGTIARQDTALSLDLNATGPGGAQANLSGTMEQDLSTANLTATGTAPLGLANRFIQPRSITGAAAFDLRLDGALQPGNLSGRITTSGARLAAPTVGVGLGDISGNITLGNSTADLTLQGTVDGGGRIAISGPVGMTSPNNAQLQINLARVRLFDPKLYETTVDGQIRINGPLAGGALIAGALNLGQTDIRIPESGFAGAGDVPEITHINEPPPVRSTRQRAGLLASQSAESSSASGPDYPLDITVSAPNRIFVRGRGLDSEFGGNLRLTGSTRNIIPIGAFQLIRGRLDILGTRLALEEARITIQGSFVPFLQLRAGTDAEEYRVNVDVVGPADNPEITFSSAPELPQEEVLSRLIFGRGLETLSPIQAARLALAVRTLAGQGGEGVVGRIRGATGLADLDVTTTDEGNTAVRAGAYLGENIYTDVTVDSTGETELNLNLDITPSLTARGGVTNTGETSLGIFFERDY